MAVFVWDSKKLGFFFFQMFRTIKRLGPTRLGNSYLFIGLAAFVIANLLYPGLLGEYMVLGANEKV